MIGDIVEYTLDDGRNKGEVRPAIIVKELTGDSYPDNPVHLHVFVTEGDFDKFPPGGVICRTFVLSDEDDKKHNTFRARKSAIPLRASRPNPPKLDDDKK